MIKYLKFNNPRIIIVLVLAISFIGMCLRFERLAKRELWGDERAFHQMCCSDGTIQMSLGELLHANLKIMQYPGDILFIWPFFKIFGLNKWALAFPRMLLTILGFYLLYRMGKLYFKTIWGYAIAFLIVAYNNNLIFHSFEVRPYSALIPLSLASFLIMKEAVEDEVPSVFKRIGIAAFIWATLLFNFYGSFILFFTYVFHLVAARGRFRGRIVIRNLKDYGLGLLLALPLWLYFIFGFDRSYMVWDPYEYIPRGVIPWLKGVFGNLVGQRLFYVFLPGVVLPFLLPYEDRRQQVQFFFILVLFPILLIFTISVVSNYYFIQRLFVWIMPLFAFLLGWTWDSVIAYVSAKHSVAVKPKR